MSSIETGEVIQALLDLLVEAYDGPPVSASTWFVDNEPDAGIFGALSGLSAAEAFASVDESGRSGTTIASHVEHLRWSLANVNSTLRGQPYNANWGESWLPLDTGEEAWERLRGALRSEFEDLRVSLRQAQPLPEPQPVILRGVLALAPHAAFHLGVMRQMVERVRAQPG